MKQSLKIRWAYAIFDHPEKPAGAVALAFKLFMEMDSNGKGAVISDQEFCDATGCSPRSCQNFKRWLIEEEFIHIHVRGARGRANEFVAHIPNAEIRPNGQLRMSAMDADIRTELSASNTGNNEDHRHPLPLFEDGMSANSADIRELSASIADGLENLPRARTHAEENNNYNIYYNNNNKNLVKPLLRECVLEPAPARAEKSSHPKPPKAQKTAPAFDPVVGPDEEMIGSGVIVNCETIRHPEFKISLKAIDMLLCGSAPMDRIKSVACGHALQWAMDIEAGKQNVLPNNITAWIRKSVVTQTNDKAVSDERSARGAARQPKEALPGGELGRIHRMVQEAGQRQKGKTLL